MSEIRPVSDLRNNFSDISRVVHANDEGVILTKNGRPDMVVMSYEASNRMQFEREVYLRLMEAELEARTTKERFAHEDVFKELYEKVRAQDDCHGV